MFALRAAVHTTPHYILVQLVFGRNSIINQYHDIDLKIIRKQKQDLINKGDKHKHHSRKKTHVQTRRQGLT